MAKIKRKTNKGKRVDRQCRNNGRCAYCRGNRLHSVRVREEAARWEMEESTEMDDGLLPASDWLVSCDNCVAQEEGRHYCLLHGRVMRDMDTVTCEDWEWREE